MCHFCPFCFDLLSLHSLGFLSFLFMRVCAGMGGRTFLSTSNTEYALVQLLDILQNRLVELRVFPVLIFTRVCNLFVRSTYALAVECSVYVVCACVYLAAISWRGWFA